MGREHFDVAILGAQPAGLIAGALLAKRKLRVVMLDHGEAESGYESGGRRLPLLLDTLPDPLHTPSIANTLKELGVGLELRHQVIPVKPALQIIECRHRVDWEPSEKLVEEVNREFPGTGAKLVYALQKLSKKLTPFIQLIHDASVFPVGTWSGRFQERRKIAALVEATKPETAMLKSTLEEHPLWSAIEKCLPFSQHLASNLHDTHTLLQSLTSFLNGAHRFIDFPGGHLDFLIQIFSQSGGIHRKGSVIEKIITDGRKISGVKVLDSRETIAADLFILSTYTLNLHNLFPHRRRDRQLAFLLDSLEPETLLYGLNLVVKPEVIPVAMGDRVLLVNGRRAPRAPDKENDPPILLQVHRNFADAEVLIQAALPVSRAKADLGPDYLDRLARQVKQRISRLVPFLSDHLLDLSSPMDSRSWDIREKGVRRLNPWLLHPVYTIEPKGVHNMSALPYKTPFSNLLLAMREVLPGLGIEGSYRVGRSAAHLAQVQLKKRDPLYR